MAMRDAFFELNNWDFVCDWWSFAPDPRVYAIPYDLQ